MTEETEISTSIDRPLRMPLVWKLAIALVVLLLLGGAGYFGFYWYNNFQTYHLATVQDGVLYRDGNRNLREFKHALLQTKAKTVVSLIDEDELHNSAKPQFLQETNYCTANSIQYIRIGVKLGGWPSSDDLKTFLGIVSNPANQPVLVHCAQGVRRTGMFVAAYQESVLHQSPTQAKDAILSFGHKAADTDDVRRFIDAYDPVKETFPAMAGGSNE